AKLIFLALGAFLGLRPVSRRRVAAEILGIQRANFRVPFGAGFGAERLSFLVCDRSDLVPLLCKACFQRVLSFDGARCRGASVSLRSSRSNALDHHRDKGREGILTRIRCYGRFEVREGLRWGNVLRETGALVTFRRILVGFRPIWIFLQIG